MKQGLHVFDIPAVASSICVATTDVLAEIQTLKVDNTFLSNMNLWLSTRCLKFHVILISIFI